MDLELLGLEVPFQQEDNKQETSTEPRALLTCKEELFHHQVSQLTHMAWRILAASILRGIFCDSKISSL